MYGMGSEVRGTSCPNEQLYTDVTGQKGTEKAAPGKAGEKNRWKNRKSDGRYRSFSTPLRKESR
jgi:hypothetical protein